MFKALRGQELNAVVLEIRREYISIVLHELHLFEAASDILQPSSISISETRHDHDVTIRSVVWCKDSDVQASCVEF